MPVEFQRIKAGGCTSLIQEVLTSARPRDFPNHCCFSILYRNTLFHRTLWNKVL